MHAREIITTHPDARGAVNEALVRCIDECFDCGQTCTACADACLGENMVQQMRQCIRACWDCADVCLATGTTASRRTGGNDEVIRRMLEACVTACRACAQECEKHAQHHEHCRISGEACRRCENTCRDALQSLQ